MGRSAGASATSSTKTAPRARSASTTSRLWTISWRTKTGAPHFSSAISTMRMARSTPAQKPRGAARSRCRGGLAIAGTSRGARPASAREVSPGRPPVQGPAMPGRAPRPRGRRRARGRDGRLRRDAGAGGAGREPFLRGERPGRDRGARHGRPGRARRRRGPSRLWRSPAWPPGGPDYVNAALALRVMGPPEAVLAALHAVEAAFGRARDARWGPRTLDLDLLSLDGPDGPLVRPDAATQDAWRALDPASQAREAPRPSSCPIPGCRTAPSCWARSPRSPPRGATRASGSPRRRCWSASPRGHAPGRPRSEGPDPGPWPLVKAALAKAAARR
jgi:hypothetical protein